MTRSSLVASLLAGSILMGALSACSKKDEGANCAELSGTSWVPSVSGASSSNHGSSSVSRSKVSLSARILGPSTPVSSSYLKSFTFSVGDLGTYGSISLVAQLTGITTQPSGNIAPMLIELTPSSTGTDLTGFVESCASSSGAFTSCSGGRCVVKNSCIANTSAYWVSDNSQAAESFTDRQFGNFTAQSVNTFPTCISAGGLGGSAGAERCNFAQSPGNLFQSGKLPSGTYTATYALVSTSSRDLDATADFDVTVVQKADNAEGGAVDLNVVLVGNDVVTQSRSDKGKANLDMLFEEVADIFSSANVRIGSINAIEWGCAGGGDAYANVPTAELGNLFKKGSERLPANEGQALNIYLVTTIVNDLGANVEGTLLGLAGGIPGPMVNGTASSGLVFSSFGALDTMNPDCAGECPRSQQEKRFRDMPATIAHEIGHFLGLNHPSEASGSQHDLIYDTPYAPNNDVLNNTSTGYLVFESYSNVQQPFASDNTCRLACPGYIGFSSSGSFCPAAQECAFNHLMFYNSKNYQLGSENEDGNLISTRSKEVLNVSPYVQ